VKLQYVAELFDICGKNWRSHFAARRFAHEPMMNRLQKKCFIAATAFHGLLALVLLFGSAADAEPGGKFVQADQGLFCGPR